MRHDLARLDATDQAELVVRGGAPASQLVDAAIKRIERLNPRLNAVIHTIFEKARQEASPPALPQGTAHGGGWRGLEPGPLEPAHRQAGWPRRRGALHLGFR